MRPSHLRNRIRSSSLRYKEGNRKVSAPYRAVIVPMKSFSALLVFLQLALTSISRVSASPIGSLESRADIAFVWNNGHEAQEERRSSNELRDNIAFTWKNEPNGRSSNVIPFGPWKDEAPDRRSSNKLRHDIGEDHKDHRSSNEIRFSNVPFDWRRSNELRTSANVAVGNQHQSRSSNGRIT
ncbi:hypothetical protein DFH07DRAFT_59481 [Mycena maculata]|uniref:Uncharacterized protein n=1 Tax=Mycena maculata TaxID=230809 RepID=A0AAD7IGK9_9AGAR|nr:hypothetical protein DFH07DRAFT_59481 [Mycena maculata]